MVHPTFRRSAERGRLSTSWLDARFSFSFGAWRDPAWDRFGVLRALNEDVIQPGTGFGPHPHADLEIFIYPLSGSVEHRDSLGNHDIVRPGEMQRMTAGAGIVHSQMNASATDPDHHLQIWLEPRRQGMAPSVAKRQFPHGDREGRWQVLVYPDGRDGSLEVDQDATILTTILRPGRTLDFEPAPNRSLYVHLVRGDADLVAGPFTGPLSTGDAAGLPDGGPVRIGARAGGAELLLFDLPDVN